MPILDRHLELDDQVALRPEAFGALRLVLSTASRLDPEVGKAFSKSFGALICDYYGLTETCGACLLVCPDFCFEVYQYETPVEHEASS